MSPFRYLFQPTIPPFRLRCLPAPLPSCLYFDECVLNAAKNSRLQRRRLTTLPQGLSGEGRRRRRSASAEQSPDPASVSPMVDTTAPFLRSPSRSPLRFVAVPRAAAYLSANGSAGPVASAGRLWAPPARSADASPSPEALQPSVGRAAAAPGSPRPAANDHRTAGSAGSAGLGHLNEVSRATPRRGPPPAASIGCCEYWQRVLAAVSTDYERWLLLLRMLRMLTAASSDCCECSLLRVFTGACVHSC